jgi:hypothetical protein
LRDAAHRMMGDIAVLCGQEYVDRYAALTKA